MAWSILPEFPGTQYILLMYRFSSSLQENFPCVTSLKPSLSILLSLPPVFLPSFLPSVVSSVILILDHLCLSLMVIIFSQNAIILLSFASAFIEILSSHSFLFFWPRLAAYRILIPRPGMEPRALAVRVLSPNHGTAREFPSHSFTINFNFSLVFYSCCF